MPEPVSRVWVYIYVVLERSMKDSHSETIVAQGDSNDVGNIV